MKPLKPGYRYEVANHQNPDAPAQVIQFIEKAPNEQGTTLETIIDGTTNEEVIKALIHRLEFQNELLQSWHTEQASAHLKLALNALEIRQNDRQAREVANSLKP